MKFFRLETEQYANSFLWLIETITTIRESNMLQGLYIGAPNDIEKKVVDCVSSVCQGLTKSLDI